MQLLTFGGTFEQLPKSTSIISILENTFDGPFEQLFTHHVLVESKVFSTDVY